MIVWRRCCMSWRARGVDYRAYGRAEVELVAERVACIVCGSVGLDTGAASLSYLLGWNNEQAVERIAAGRASTVEAQTVAGAQLERDLLRALAARGGLPVSPG
jgi:hypothetical protein